mmetsp:Transcript_81030/g.146276  ORF Transcript_81030/g.146276 Transcript_81030/m.146276 type:complete len:213 (+) Transcript_81030:442-1080(+)
MCQRHEVKGISTTTDRHSLQEFQSACQELDGDCSIAHARVPNESDESRQSGQDRAEYRSSHLWRQVQMCQRSQTSSLHRRLGMGYQQLYQQLAEALGGGEGAGGRSQSPWLQALGDGLNRWLHNQEPTAAGSREKPAEGYRHRWCSRPRCTSGTPGAKHLERRLRPCMLCKNIEKESPVEPLVTVRQKLLANKVGVVHRPSGTKSGQKVKDF